MSNIRQDGWPDKHGGRTRKLRDHIVAPEPPDSPDPDDASRPVEQSQERQHRGRRDRKRER